MKQASDVTVSKGTAVKTPSHAAFPGAVQAASQSIEDPLLGKLPTHVEPAVSQDTLRERAYLLWEAAGRPEGLADEFWYQAEQELGAVRSKKR